MELKGFLLITFLGLLDIIHALSIGSNEKDQSFPAEFTVNNRTITCNGGTHGKAYSQLMFICDDIKVDGWVIFHGNVDFIEDYSDENDDPNLTGCPDCPCGSFDAEPTDITALCTAMLASSGVSQRVMAAYAKPVCTQKDREQRTKFFLADGKETWLDVYVNNGYIKTLQCLVEKKVKVEISDSQ